MKKRQVKKNLNKVLRSMSNEELIDLHVNHQGDKHWPLVDIEITKRFDYQVELINLKVVAHDTDDTQLKMVKL